MNIPKNKLLFGLVAMIIFLIGCGYIVYSGRAVMLIGNKTGTASSTAPGHMGTYTMAEVQTHNSATSCWSVIGGDVYDLTTWIGRHPGGPEAILGLCGTDGTTAFTNQHGNQGRPRAILALLKIGSLKQ